MMQLLISMGRIMYAIGYKDNIVNRIGGGLLASFTMSIGVGYALLVGATAFGWNLMD